MFNYTKAELSEIANKQNFIRDTLEKVVRLSEVLDYINSNPIMKGCLALKGGGNSHQPDSLPSSQAIG